MITIIIRVTDYGAKPDSGEDAVTPVQQAIAAAAAIDGPVTLEFQKGRYDFYPDHAVKEPHFISNTTTEEENPDVTKTFGLLFEQMRDTTVEGNNSLLMFHGKMTLLALIQCDNIEIRNLNADYVRPTMSEMTVEAVEPHHLDVRVHPDSWYTIENGSLLWVGEGWRYSDGPAQQFDPLINTTWRVTNPVTMARQVEELEPYRIRLHYTCTPEVSVGHVYQMRDGIRDQVGLFISRSRNIAFRQVGMHYMHGLGIVGQFSENLAFDQLSVTPRSESGRTAAAFADCIHLSGCRGKVTIANSQFEGAHDDVINVHGTHLCIIDKPSPYQLKVRFMHGQSYGFDAFFPGDEIDFIRESTLLAYNSNKILRAERTSPREILLTLERPAPEQVEDGDVVENVTWTPEVDICNNRFARIPTRGILVTTRRKVRIENNVFERMKMSGVLVSDDASSWYESGMVTDLTIRGNRFIECGSPVIGILPENKMLDESRPVHSNIYIEDNEFWILGGAVLQAKSTQGIRFLRNRIMDFSIIEENDRKQSPCQLLACSDVVWEDNVSIQLKETDRRLVEGS